MSIEQAKKELIEEIFQQMPMSTTESKKVVEKIDALIVARVLDALQGVPKVPENGTRSFRFPD